MNKKTVTLIIIFGVIVRLVLSVFSYHPDLSVYAFAGKIIVVDGHWLNFYDYSVEYIDGIARLFPHQMVLNYQPLAYLLPSIVYLPFYSVLKATADAITSSTWDQSGLFYLPLFVYKLPMILADIGIIFLLPKLFTSLKNQRLAQILWSLNPLSFYVASLLGQTDSIITLFLVITLIAIKRKRFYLAAMSLALSALIKPAALVLLPLLLIHFFANRKYFTGLKVFLSGILVYLLFIAPYFGSQVYRHYALFADQIGKSTYAAISVASGHDISWLFIIFSLTLGLLLYKKISLIPALTAVLFSSLAFTHFHPQWLLWVMPWFIYLSLKSKQYLPLLFTFLSWLIIVFSFDKSLHTALFFGLNLPDLSLKIFDSNLIRSIVSLARSWFVAYLFVILFVHGQAKDTSDK